MDLFTNQKRAVKRGPNEGPSHHHSMSRRGLLCASAALLAAACNPESQTETPALLPDDPVGRARGGAGNTPLPPARKFQIYAAELRERAAGRDVSLVDLDTLDANISAVKSQLGSAFALRLVTKSLPSLALLEYMMKEAGTNRLMAFSEGLLRALLERFGTGVDILLGRPSPVEAAQRTFAESPAAAAKVRWLIDTRERMLEYRDLAVAQKQTIRVAVEIDVGLRRGGARTVTELLDMLDVIAKNPDDLSFAGFMGYDGHVPFAPPGFSSDKEFEAVHERYSDFVQAATDAYPGLFGGDLVMNTGGSGTYYRYVDGLSTPANEIAMGSAFLLPAHFADLATLGLVAAAFQASPILKRIEPAELPFAEGYLPMLAKSDPSLEVSYYMVGGGFAGDLVYPDGLVPNPYMPESDGVKNLMTNQTLRNGPKALPLGVGDFVFYQPWEAGSLVWLSALEVFRNGELKERWATFQEGCLKGCGGAQLSAAPTK